MTRHRGSGGSSGCAGGGWRGGRRPALAAALRRAPRARRARRRARARRRRAGEARLAAIDAPRRRVRDGRSTGAGAQLATPAAAVAFGSSAAVAVAGGRLRGARARWSGCRAGCAAARRPAGDEVAVARPHPPAGAGSRGRLRRGRRSTTPPTCAAAASPASCCSTGPRDRPAARRRRRRRRRACGSAPSARWRRASRGRGGARARDGARRRTRQIDEATRDDSRRRPGAPARGERPERDAAGGARAAAAGRWPDSGRAGARRALLGLVAALRAARRRRALAPARRGHGRRGHRGDDAVAAGVALYALLLAAAATLALNPRAPPTPAGSCRSRRWPGSSSLGPAAAAGAAAGRGARAAGDAGPGAAARAGRPARRWRTACDHAWPPRSPPRRCSAHHFGAVPLAGLPANLLALPAVAPVMWLGMVKAALGQLAARRCPRPRPARRRLGPIARLPVAYIDWLAERFARCRAARLALPLGSRGRGRGRLRAARAAAWRSAAPPGRSRRAPTPRPRPGGACGPAALRARAVVAVRRGSRSRSRRRSRRRPGPAAHGPLPRRRPGRRHADPAPRRRRGPLRRRPARGRMSPACSAGGGATARARGRHPCVARPPRRPARGARALPGRPAARRRRRHPRPAFRAVLAEARRRGVRRSRAVAPLSLRAGAVAIRVLSPPPRPPGPAARGPQPARRWWRS